MESAFGIDHGYETIEKFGFGALGTKMAGAAVGGGNKLRRAGAAGIRGSASAQKPGGTGVAGFMGRSGMQAGGGLKKLGQGMAARPGLAGGLAAGGAAGGAGGAGGMFMNRRRQ
jgi:hypothetical protein